MYLGGENIGSYKQEKPVLGGYPNHAKTKDKTTIKENL